MWPGLFWLSDRLKREGLPHEGGHLKHYERVMGGEVSSAGTPTGQTRVWAESPWCTWLTPWEYLYTSYLRISFLISLSRAFIHALHLSLYCSEDFFNIDVKKKKKKNKKSSRMRAASPGFAVNPGDLVWPVRGWARSAQSSRQTSLTQKHHFQCRIQVFVFTDVMVDCFTKLWILQSNPNFPILSFFAVVWM